MAGAGVEPAMTPASEADRFASLLPGLVAEPMTDGTEEDALLQLAEDAGPAESIVYRLADVELLDAELVMEVHRASWVGVPAVSAGAHF